MRHFFCRKDAIIDDIIEKTRKGQYGKTKKRQSEKKFKKYL